MSRSAALVLSCLIVIAGAAAILASLRYMRRGSLIIRPFRMVDRQRNPFEFWTITVVTLLAG